MEKNVAVREWCLERAMATYLPGFLKTLITVEPNVVTVGKVREVRLDIAEIIKISKSYEKYVNDG